jgi:hypothetical protein
MGYVGTAPLSGDYRKLDDISGTFDGDTNVTFNLTVGSVAVTPPKETTLLISVGGILQEPVSAYTISGSTITFTAAPESGADFFGVMLGDTLSIGTPADDTVTGAKIVDNAIDSEHYTDGSIDNAHIADDAIDSEHYAAGSIDTAHYAAGSVDTTALGADSVTAAKIGDNVIDSEHYAAASIDNEHLADDAVDSDELAEGAVDTAHIADNQITLAKMAGGIDGNIISYDANGDPVAIATGDDGQVLTSAGADNPPAFEDAAGGIAWQAVTTGSTLSATAGNGYPINTTSNACTVTLPGSASVGDQIIFTDYARNWDTNALTINQNSLKYQGYATPNPVYDTGGESIHLVYMDATQGWVPLYDGTVAMETPQFYDVEYLVVAGGGGGGRQIAGGGGAGGYRTNYGGSAISFDATGDGGGGTVYTITVGAGGSGSTHISDPDLSSQKGGNSSLSGSDITDITSTGGGGGSNYNSAGATGGSGGGAAIYSQAGGAGNEGGYTPVEGYAGGSSPSTPGGGGGGGGSSAVGANAVAPSGGNGGAGTANSITGASVTYAGGGGGAGRTDGANSGIGGTGGSGGGGDGVNDHSAPTAGTDGLGGGGGASGWSGISDSTHGADGGNGVVILRMVDAKYSGTTTGSPTVATDVGGSGETTVTFLVDGTYTA